MCHKSTPVLAAVAGLENITLYNSYVNAFVDVADRKDMLRQAEEAAQRWENGNPKSPLDGAIVGYKMNFCTTDLRTTCGSNMLENFKAPYTATAIELLQEAGAITGGKVNMDEFGMGALGSDTGGSVRLPASYCGVVGFKPSYGRISRWGLVAYASSLDTVGTLTKSVDDAKIIYDIISKGDPKDSTCLTQRQREAISKAIRHIGRPAVVEDTLQRKRLSGVRIGIPQEFNIAELSPETKSLWKQGIAALKEAGANVVPVSIPNTKLAVGAYFTLATAEASSNLQRYDGVRYGHQSTHADEKDALYANTRSEGFGKEVRRRILLGTYVLTSGSFDNFFLRAQKIRQMIRSDFDKIFARPNVITGYCPSSEADPSKVHALLTPVAVTTAPKLEDCVGDHIDPINAYLDDILTIPASLAGLPAMSVPFGKCAKDGFPVGLQVMSQYGDEEMVFDVARVLEEKGRMRA
ncbi:Glu-AdT subunit A [Mortierella antarctica]|nr:Glu-AdT subunit A [Mortierella antarctica]